MEPVFSRRLSIQWGEEEAYEDTITWILTAGNGQFVDVRIDAVTCEPQWLITGEEVEIPTADGFDFSLNFVHRLDSIHGENSDLSTDTGHFRTLADNTRLEEGIMYNDSLGKVMPYKEIWQSIDISNSSPHNLTPVHPTAAKNSLSISTVWELHCESKTEARGLLVFIGSVGQGIVEFKGSFQCVRLWDGAVVYHYGGNIQELFGQFIGGYECAQQFSWRQVFPEQAVL